MAVGGWSFYWKYFATIGARFFLVSAGTTSGRVISANFSAVAHSQVRAYGRRSTAVAMKAWLLPDPDEMILVRDVVAPPRGAEPNTQSN